MDEYSININLANSYTKDMNKYDYCYSTKEKWDMTYIYDSILYEGATSIARSLDFKRVVYILSSKCICKKCFNKKNRTI